jgi:transposase
LQILSDDEYPQAKKIVLITDNLNTHSRACLYERFSPAEARRLAQCFEWHYTPEHGSWLNMTEIELSLLARQRTKRRIPDKPTLTEQVADRETSRNNSKTCIIWQFRSGQLGNVLSDAENKARHSRASGNLYRAKPKTQWNPRSSQLVLRVSYRFPPSRE